MVFHHFGLQVSLRVFLICVTAVVLVLVAYVSGWYITAFCLAGALVVQVGALIGFVKKTNRELTRFLSAIRHNDFTQRFVSDGRDRSFRELNVAFNEVISAFQNIKAEKEAHHQYLQTIIEHIGTGILSFDSKGEVRLINQGAKDLLQLPHVKNVQALNRLSPALEETILELGNGEKKMISLERKGQPLLLMLQCTTLRSQGEELRIISLHNIRSEMEEQELEAWQKLIRVLTHEIMNSVTPVISLASTLNSLIDSHLPASHGPAELEEEVLLDIRTGLRTIEKRSTGMLHFVESYRKLTRVRKPQLEHVPLPELLTRVQQLLKPELESRHIKFVIEVAATDVQLTADPELVEQVLINLVKNAMEACHNVDNACVKIQAYADDTEHGRLRLDVRDNGPGIPAEIMDKIFVPFYTTKAQGSGIGLSLSRQIMRMHKGSLRVRSKPGETVVSLVF